jgi:hypothetical protein
MPLPIEFVDEFRELSDHLWSACTKMPADAAEMLLNGIGDNAEDLLNRFPECASAPACGELLASWSEFYSCAAEYVTSSDRLEECIWLVGSPHTIDPLPIELTQAHDRQRCAVAALSAAMKSHQGTVAGSRGPVPHCRGEDA